MKGRLYRAATAIVLGAAVLGAQAAPAGWDAVVTGYREALQKSGIAGSSLMIIRDGQVFASPDHARHDLPLGFDHQDVHRHRHHAAA
jgi:hypothetical protein